MTILMAVLLVVLGYLLMFVCSAVTCDQGNPGMVVVFGAVGYWNATPLLCCCLLDVLLCFGCVGAFVAVGCR